MRIASPSPERARAGAGEHWPAALAFPGGRASWAGQDPASSAQRIWTVETFSTPDPQLSFPASGRPCALNAPESWQAHYEHSLWFSRPWKGFLISNVSLIGGPMGRTLPSITQAFLQEQECFRPLPARPAAQRPAGAGRPVRRRPPAPGGGRLRRRTPCPSRSSCWPCCWRSTKRCCACGRSWRACSPARNGSRRSPMETLTGWLLDLRRPGDGLVLWLLGEDGRRLRLRQPFPVTFYAAGPPRPAAPAVALPAKPSRSRCTWRATSAAICSSPAAHRAGGRGGPGASPSRACSSRRPGASPT